MSSIRSRRRDPLRLPQSPVRAPSSPPCRRRTASASSCSPIGPK
ncbi:unnamed protein product [Linum tenue]|uniref:Uncharacterized protein n=1 Tax=Linum tenue TaxID=586396 RepID=A0AAV0I542_9ROSI|nr:unnamed protein product [Linum tenue]